MKKLILLCVALCLATATKASNNVVVVWDGSGSMSDSMGNESKMEVSKKALQTVLSKLPPDSKVGIVLFSSYSDGWIYPLGPVDKTKILAQIQEASAGGGTPLGFYMKVGADALLSLRDKEKYGNYRLLVVTDGEANDASLVEAYLPDILSRGITVDVIGVNMDSDHSLATKVSSYRRADDANSLTSAIAQVFAETSDKGNDGDGDFQMLSGIPVELASSALKALSESRNQPIGEAPHVKVDDQGQVIFDKSGQVVLESPPSSNRNMVIGFILVGSVVLLGLLAVLAAVSQG